MHRCFGRQHRTRAWPFLVFLPLLAIVLADTGCMSIRYTTNLKPDPGHAAALKGCTFRVDRVEFSRSGPPDGMTVPFVPTNAPDDADAPTPNPMIWNEAKWQAELTRAATARYPGLFAAGREACPLSVSIRAVTRTSMKASIAAEIGTLTVLGGILPLPIREIGQVEVVPTLEIDDGLTRIPLSGVQFERRDVGWITCFTPLAAIPVPGHADRREFATIPGMEKGFVPKGVGLTVDSCIDAIVLSLSASEAEIRKALSGRGGGRELHAP
jgi:hypothetical protein